MTTTAPGISAAVAVEERSGSASRSPCTKSAGSRSPGSSRASVPAAKWSLSETLTSVEQRAPMCVIGHGAAPSGSANQRWPEDRHPLDELSVRHDTLATASLDLVDPRDLCVRETAPQIRVMLGEDIVERAQRCDAHDAE